MAHHRREAGAMRGLHRIQRFSQCADLVHLHQDGVCTALGNAAPQPLHVGHEQIVAHQLHAAAQRGGEVRPALPIVLGAAIFDRGDGVAAHQIGQIGHHLRGIERFPFTFHGVSAAVVEFGGRAIQRERHVLAGPIAGLLAGPCDEAQRLIGRFQIGREAAFVAYIGAVPGIVQRLLQLGENLRADPHRLGHRAGRHRLNHEFLDVDGVVGMFAAVHDVHHRHRQRAGEHAAHITIQRHVQIGRRRAGHGQAHRQYGVGPQPRLVGRAVQLDHRLVDGNLLLGIEAADGVQYLALDVGDGLPHALAAIAPLVAIPQLHGLVRAGRCARGHRRAAFGTRFQEHIHFHSGVAPAVQNFAGDDIGDGAHGRMRPVLLQAQAA